MAVFRSHLLERRHHACSRENVACVIQLHYAFHSVLEKWERWPTSGRYERAQEMPKGTRGTDSHSIAASEAAAVGTSW